MSNRNKMVNKAKIILTSGCSFTQYSYPTWADFIAMHYDVDVINHALPGYGNDIIKKKLCLQKCDYKFFLPNITIVKK